VFYEKANKRKSFAYGCGGALKKLLALASVKQQAETGVELCIYPAAEAFKDCINRASLHEPPK
jgi:hypothetical protein